MTVLIDSSAWFEFFFGTSKGLQVKRVVNTSEEILSSPVILCEIYAKYLKNAPNEAEEKKNYLLTRCKIIPLTTDIALDAARLKTSKNLPFADSLIYATANKTEVQLLTCDNNFRGLKNVKIL